jgi:hypothetical protein
MSKNKINHIWSPINSGLQIKIELPEYNLIANETAELLLFFKNSSKEFIRIYLINSEPFRFGQSTFYLYNKQKQLITMQPTPRPHGITITDRDFHLIEPGGHIEFSQHLHLNGLEPVELGEYLLKWDYENKLKSWAGGVKTLDGITLKLFKGRDIPYIWVGKIEWVGKIYIQTGKN